MNLPAWDIRHVDLGAAEPALAGEGAPVFAVFWWGATPLGARAYLPPELPLRRAQLAALATEFAALQRAVRADDLGACAWADLDGRPQWDATLQTARDAEDLVGRLDAWAAPAIDPADDLSLIICTRDRPAELNRCLNRLAAQSRPPGEIIVVDNSRDMTAHAVCAGRPVVYLHEPRRGLSAARNAGIRASRGGLVGFTDDDVELHPAWCSEIVAAFARSGAAVVTGAVFPAALATPAQQAFQFEMGGLQGGCTPMAFDHRFFEGGRGRGAQVWRLGAGANMAFRREVFDEVGLFDERLGAGAAGCSEDSELWYRVLAGGGACLYEPRAAAFHHHREDWAGLRRQIRAYMKGHAAALVAQADRFGHAANWRRLLRQLPVYFAWTAFACLKNNQPVRAALLPDEIIGWAQGLQYVFRPGWRGRRPPARGVGASGA